MKKGVSSVVVVVLITGLAVAAASILGIAIMVSVDESVEGTEAKIEAISNINLEVISAEIEKGSDGGPDLLKILVRNSGKQNISGFIVKVYGTKDIYSNNSVYLPDNVMLGPHNTDFIVIIPAPDPDIYGEYTKIEVIAKFQFKGVEETAEAAKDSVTYATPRGDVGDDEDPYGSIPVVPSEDEPADDEDLLGKIRAVYTRSATDDRDLDELKSHGINAFIIKGGYGNNVDYSSYEDNLPDSVKQFASWAKQKDMMFFQALNFAHFTTHPESGTPSIVTNNHVVYSDGTTSGHVSPWDETYWNHLTELTVNLANLSVAHPDEYRIDGIWFDFELYHNDKKFINRAWGFEDSTFNKYLTARGLEDPGLAAAERFSWLESNNKLDDYYLFLEETINQLAENLKNEVKAVNPDFLIGAYPSPLKTYLSDIYSGWSSRNEPAVIWGTEMYSLGGADRIPSGLNDALLDEGYYNFQDVSEYEREIYAYYVGGMINYRYPPTNWAYNLYNVDKESSGYWIYTARIFTEDFESLGTYQDLLLCYDSSDNTMNTCKDSAEHDESVDLYYQQMDIATEELNKLANDENYQTYLTKILPEPQRYHDAEINSSMIALLNTLTLNSIQPQSGSISLSEIPRFRGQHNFIIKAEQDKNVEIEIKSVPVGGYNNAVTYKIIDSDSNEISSGKIALSETDIVSFVAPNDGYYALLVNPSTGSFNIMSMNVPMMLYISPGERIHTLKSSSIYFWVTSSFDIGFEGSGGEGLKATIYKPTATGYELVDSGETDEFIDSFSLAVDVSVGDLNKIWKLTISEPSTQYFEDVYIDFGDDIQLYFGLTDNEMYFMG